MTGGRDAGLAPGWSEVYTARFSEFCLQVRRHAAASNDS
jgi:hypothetical protein